MSGMLTWLKLQFAGAIEVLAGATGSYAWAIVLITIAIRVLVAPLFVVQMRSMKRMQELQPEIQRIRERHKGNPEKLNKETMELYRKEKINPLAGCLPMLIQFPFLIAMYRVLYELSYDASFAKTGMFGFIELGQPDPFFVLPALSAVATFGQSWLGGQGADPTQRAMVYIMPLFIFWITKGMPAGVALYWLVSTLVGIVQQGLVTGFRKGGKPKGAATAK